jgi:hypothetical protein
MKRSEIKQLLLESLLEVLNTPEEKDKYDFLTGQKYAINDRQRGIEDRDISQQSKAFKKGYKSVMGGWWDKVNSKLTNFVGAFGYGNSRKLE